MSEFPLGLVVGKFAPLHLGHERLIQQAAASCERLLILSYTKPEFPLCGVDQRREWLASRFPEHDCLVFDDSWLERTCEGQGIQARPIPQNDAADIEHQTWLAWFLDEVVKDRPDAFFCNEDYGPSTALTLGNAFGKTVTAVLVDKERTHHPISASAIRATPELAKRWTSPEVSASFVRRIALIGGESTGKTTLAAALAKELGTVWVPEYGRELWELKGGRLVESDLLEIAREQIRREDRMARDATNWLICDTTPLTTFGYSQWMFGRADPELARLAQRPYDVVLLCSPDFEFVQDGTRQGDHFRLVQHTWYIKTQTAKDSEWLITSGTVHQRLDQIQKWIDMRVESMGEEPLTLPRASTS